MEEARTRRFCGLNVSGSMHDHLMEHVAALAESEEPGDRASPISALPSLYRTDYETHYLSFGKPLEMSQNWLYDTLAIFKRDTGRVEQFRAELRGAVLELLEPRFAGGWSLDGTFEEAVSYDTYEKEQVVDKLVCYRGCWARLKRLVL